VSYTPRVIDWNTNACMFSNTFVPVSVPWCDHTNLHTLIYLQCRNMYISHTWPDIDRRKHPPRGGFLFGRFPNQEPGGRGPPSKNLIQILRGGSSSSGYFVREPAAQKKNPGGGGSCNQHSWIYLHFQRYIYGHS